MCTNTLELGIDIGAVKSIVQIGPPPTVASLRQRLGRSGRRQGEAAILRGICIEAAPSRISAQDDMHEDTFELTAMVQLLLDNWFEPPRATGLHLSTLVQQILSVIAQGNGATAGGLYSLLCGPKAPFCNVSKSDFLDLLKGLGEKGLLMQDSGSELLHGRVGQSLVNHYSFYAAFCELEEFRVVAGSTTLGTLPLTTSLKIKSCIIFAGRYWEVQSIDEVKRVICVVLSPGGTPPQFNPTKGMVHSRVRHQMRTLYESNEPPVFLDAKALEFLERGREVYARRDFRRRVLVRLSGGQAMMYTWMGDGANRVIEELLTKQGIDVKNYGLFLYLRGPVKTLKNIDSGLKAAASDIVNKLARGPEGYSIVVPELLADLGNLTREKWDWTLTRSLLEKTFAANNLDIEEACEWILKTPIE